ncbi:MAG: twin-arginine translocase subunit TatC [Rickettsiales bacterium]|jgi:sec-independent protein translocase protein TatC|nr:twin-arginine translocase subunit TatC [Rickettsiales bacterium]
MTTVKMRFIEHIAELRARVLWCALFFAAAFAAGWVAAPSVRDFLLEPLAASWPDGTVMYSSLTAGLTVHLSLSVLTALVLSLPFFAYQAWRFARPALGKGEARVMLSVVWASPVFFALGAAFVYFFLMPVMFGFFVGFAESDNFASVLLPDMSGYVGLTLGLMKSFGLAFQFPVALVVMNRVGILERAPVVKARRFVWVGMFALAAVLTPPDIVSCVALAVPLILLFEGSLLFMKRG